jgi:hypothetical protein
VCPGKQRKMKDWRLAFNEDVAVEKEHEKDRRRSAISDYLYPRFYR